MKKRFLITCLLLVIGYSSVGAQEPNFENKTIRIVVGFSAGGGFDAYARAIARHLRREGDRVLALWHPSQGGRHRPDKIMKDAAGLTFPRILSLIINEAARSLEEGVAEADEIDVAMRLGVNYPIGPLRWADQIGLDEVLAVLEALERETGDDRYRAAPLIKRLVVAGFLGETSGRGFYTYKEQVRS